VTGLAAGGSGVMSRPSQRTRPAAGVMKPATVSSSVLLPAPDGPMIAVELPARMVRSAVSRHSSCATVTPSSSSINAPPAIENPEKAEGKADQYQCYPCGCVHPVAGHQPLHQEGQSRYVGRREEGD